jgi:DNA-binding NarL/FixJ family response regulator
LHATTRQISALGGGFGEADSGVASCAPPRFKAKKRIRSLAQFTLNKCNSETAGPEHGITGVLAECDARKETAANIVSHRERQVLILVVEGLTNKEIAGRLSVAVPTVNQHVHNLYLKFGIRNQTQLAISAVRRGLVIL